MELSESFTLTQDTELFFVPFEADGNRVESAIDAITISADWAETEINADLKEYSGDARI